MVDTAGVEKLFHGPHTVQVDETTMTVLQAFNDLNSDKRQRRAILSLIVDKFSRPQLKTMMPGITMYEMNEARKHLLAKGRGAQVQKDPTFRTGATFPKAQHFLNFVMENGDRYLKDRSWGHICISFSTGEKQRVAQSTSSNLHLISTRVLR